MEKENAKGHADDKQTEKLSKEDMARVIAGRVSSKANEDIPYYDDTPRRSSARAQSSVYRASTDNPQFRRLSEEEYRRIYGYPDFEDSSDRPKKKKKKKKKRGHGILLGISVTLVLLVAAVGVCGWMWFTNGKKSYDGVFLANTYINGINVSNNTPEQAAELIAQDSDMPEAVTITLSDGEDVVIKLSDVGLSDNISDTVKDFYTQQNHNEWYSAQASKAEYNFVVKYDFDKGMLDDEIDRRIVEGDTGEEPQNAYIKSTSKGFEIVPEVAGTAIDEAKIKTLYDYIDDYIDQGKYEINLSDCDCYQQAEITSDDLKEELEKLNSLYNIELTFDFTYTTETLKGSEIMDWITFNDDDPTAGYTVDADKAMTYVEELADKYDTYNKDRKFKTTNKGTITLEQGRGDYGWWIDQQKTCDMIVELIEEGTSTTTEPIYYTNPDSQYTYTCNPDVRTAKGDIGSTYIEIDLAEQHLWYYVKGKLKYECDIVSGKPTEARNTPAGVYKLWYKELNKTLSGTNEDGESWSTPVTYWNNVSTFGVGLHDATWHTYFGGDRYIEYGSHGCINMPLEAAKYVYENIELNTPVIMYWDT